MAIVWTTRILGVCLLGGAVAGTTQGAEPSRTAKEAFFEKRIRPLLVQHCLDCHAGARPESQLRLDSLAGMLRGGIRGPAIVPGEPEKSLLVHALRHSERLQMPPKRKLPGSDIVAVVRWIDEGAVWPNALPVRKPNPGNALDVQFTESERSFWAFQRPVPQAIPAVNERSWVKSPIDAFVLRRLEAEGIPPAPQADKRSLLRRVSFDLTGLPPTPEAMAAFLADDSPDAFARVVERLLASPHYGERWGRHWLDVARYADSNGLDENLCHANAYRYRDYVIRAFNHDKPFDRFAKEQIAGDLLNDVPGDHPFDPIIATGFLVIGPKMLAEDDPVKLQMDIIDEQLDTIGKGFMGLTLGCARCHDHKFDPIPTADYYALAGIFKSTQTMDSLKVVAKWHEENLEVPEVVAARSEHQRKLMGIKQKIAAERQEATEVLLREARARLSQYLLAAEAERRRQKRLSQLQTLGDLPAERRPEGVLIREAEEFDRGNVRKDHDDFGAGIGVLINKGQRPNFVEYDIDVTEAGTYQFELRLAAAAARPCQLSVNGKVVANDIADAATGSWNPESQRWFVEAVIFLGAGKNTLRLQQPEHFPHIDKLLIAPLATPGDCGLRSFQPSEELIPEFVSQWAEQMNAAADVPDSPLHSWVQKAASTQSISSLQPLAEKYAAMLGDDNAFRELVTSESGPFRIPAALDQRFSAQTRQRLGQLAKQHKELERSVPKFPKAMAVQDVDTPANIHIHYRGDHLTQGPEVPRHFLRIIPPGESPSIPEGRSGRLALANWLTAPEHPLTARVIVNRIWHWHFGAGLVRTPDNFGRLGERPTHPELLDWLARQFVASGWSIKDLHRRILLSSTWQMSSQPNLHAQAIDPENRLLWHMPRRRLEAEEVRDAILMACGNLERNPSKGPPLPTANRAYVTTTRKGSPSVYSRNHRSVYLPVIRSHVYELFTAFDFADPAVSSGTRQSTTIAPQALFMMNSQLVAEHTRTRACRLLEHGPQQDAARVTELYLEILSRSPSQAEQVRALRFIAAQQHRFAATSKAATNLAELRAWQSLIRVLLASNEFLFVS